MKTNEHPMKPTEDQIREWARFDLGAGLTPEGLWHRIACAAYAAGADAELEACVEWVQDYAECGDSLRAARRPKPPSLKQQALDELTAWAEMRNGPGESLLCDGLSVAIIRRALEALPND